MLFCIWLNLLSMSSSKAVNVSSSLVDTSSTANTLASMQTRSPAILPPFSALLEGWTLSTAFVFCGSFFSNFQNLEG